MWFISMSVGFHQTIFLLNWANNFTPVLLFVQSGKQFPSLISHLIYPLLIWLLAFNHLQHSVYDIQTQPYLRK